MSKSRGNRPQPYIQNNAYYPRQTQEQYNRQLREQNTGKSRSRTQPNYEQEYEKPNAFLSGMLYSLAIVSICVFIGLLAFRSAGIGHIIRNTNIYYLLEQATDEEHSYYIVNQVNSLHFHDQYFNLQDVADFMQRESVSNEIGIIVDGYANAFVLGNLDHHITTEDIINMTRNLEPDFYEFFDYRMTEADREHLATTLDDVLDFDSLSVGGLMEDIEDFNVDISIPLTLISPTLLWAIGILCVLLLVAIFIIRKDNPSKAALAVGITLAISGLLTFLGGLLAGTYAGTVRSDIYVFSISGYVEYLSNLLSQYGFTFSAVGILIILISIMADKVARMSQKSAKLKR